MIESANGPVLVSWSYSLATLKAKLNGHSSHCDMLLNFRLPYIIWYVANIWCIIQSFFWSGKKAAFNCTIWQNRGLDFISVPFVSSLWTFCWTCGCVAISELCSVCLGYSKLVSSLNILSFGTRLISQIYMYLPEYALLSGMITHLIKL